MLGLNGLAYVRPMLFKISLLIESFIVLLTPEITKEVFLDNDDNFSSKEGWAVVLGPTFENGLMLRDFDDHKYHRTLLQDSFRHDAIQNYLSIIQPIIDSWVESIKTQTSFNLYESIKQLMFDISLSLFSIKRLYGSLTYWGRLQKNANEGTIVGI